MRLTTKSIIPPVSVPGRSLDRAPLSNHRECPSRGPEIFSSVIISLEYIRTWLDDHRVLRMMGVPGIASMSNLSSAPRLSCMPKILCMPKPWCMSQSSCVSPLSGVSSVWYVSNTILVRNDIYASRTIIYTGCVRCIYSSSLNTGNYKYGQNPDMGVGFTVCAG